MGPQELAPLVADAPTEGRFWGLGGSLFLGSLVETSTTVAAVSLHLLPLWRLSLPVQDAHQGWWLERFQALGRLLKAESTASPSLGLQGPLCAAFFGPDSAAG